MHTNSLQSRFATDGYLVIDNFLTPERCQKLRTALQRHKPSQPADRDNSVIGSYDTACDTTWADPLKAADVDFTALAADPTLSAITGEMLGEAWTVASSIVFWLHPGGRGQAWHQDCRTDGRKFNLNRLFYISDVHRDDGAVVVVPGSHRRGRIHAGGAQEDLPGQVILTPKAGTLVLLSGLCWHRVTPNCSRRERISINLRAFPAGTPNTWDSTGVYRDADVDWSTLTVVRATTT